MKKLFLFLLFAVTGMALATAQPINDQPRPMKLKSADEYYATGQDLSALERYEEILANDKTKNQPLDLAILNKIAKINMGLRDFQRAEKALNQLVKADKANAYSPALFDLGRVQKMNKKYDEAKTTFEQFLTMYNGADVDRYKTLVTNEIKGCALAKEYASKKQEEVIFKNLGNKVNSPSQEASPVSISADEVMFASLMSDSIIGVTGEQTKFMSLFKSKKTADGWADAVALGPEVNKPGFNTFAPALSLDKGSIYFTRCLNEVNKIGNCRLFRSSYSGGSFGESESLAFNSNDYSCKHPTIATIDGKEAIIFTSEMSGGQGGEDLWYAVKNADGTFGTPLNMGEEVNTPGDEVTPHFYNGKLYFSSTGHPGIGGLDVFEASLKNNGTFGNVENMGAGFNSSHDDLYFSIAENPCQAFMTTNRPGTISLKSETCCDDVFHMILPERCPVIVDAKTFDVSSNAALSGCKVRLMDEAGKEVDMAKNDAANTFTFDAKRNKKYKLIASRDGYLDGSADINTSGLSNDKPGKVEGKLYLDPRIRFKVRTFDAKSKAPLSGVDVQLEDEKGNKIETKSTGNGNEVSFDVVSGKSFRVVGTKSGMATDAKGFKSDDMRAIAMLDLNLGLPIFDTIYYDFDKSDIRQPDATATMVKVIETLKAFPTLVVEVGSHTDAKGSNSYNDSLSTRRTNSAMKYLEEKGIPATQLIPKHYGEEQPVAPNEMNGKDFPDGRQRNRRTVFKIVSGVEGSGLSADQTVSKPTVPASQPAPVTKPAPAPKAAPAKTAPKQTAAAKPATTAPVEKKK